MGGELGVLLAFAGGVLSLLSPCVLPLAPPYLAYLSGQSIEQMTDPSRDERLLTRLALAALGLMALAFGQLILTGGQVGLVGGGAMVGAVGALGVALSRDAVTRRVFASALCFVLGLATVFVALGATASVVGQVLLANKFLFGQIAGVIIYALGQHFIGLRRSVATMAILLGVWALTLLLQGADLPGAIAENAAPLALLIVTAVGLQLTGLDHVPFLYREARFDAGGAAGGYLGAYVIGLAFAFGWTPCIGPILGTILAVAGQRDTIGEGVAMLSVYAAGLGLPFLLAALFVRPFMRFMRAFRRHMGRVETAMGGLLVLVGLLMATGRFEALAFWLLETFPALGLIG
ncbi:MAG: cytochrome c biogenesis CcdA family protein [Rubrimonas sp.]